MADDLTPTQEYSAQELAERFDLKRVGDSRARIIGVCALTPGRSDHLAFIQQPRYTSALADSKAGVIIVPPALADAVAGTALVSDSPRLMFARIAALFDRAYPAAGIAASAVVDPSAAIAENVHIGANAVIGQRVQIGASTIINAGAVIDDDVAIGDRGWIGPRASVLAGCRIGAHTRIGAGAVIGERGFGWVAGPDGLEPVPQIGCVIIEDRVEIGANTTIDRGALDDTIIGTGVKIDNQVHVAHNCVIGAHTVIAGCTGIAGSCSIGSRCMIGGGVGIGDHVMIADGVVITAASQVPKNIEAEGVYSSTFRAMPARSWRKRLALFRALDRIEARLSRVETKNGMSGDP